MKFHYSKPQTEVAYFFSGMPLCGSTGEKFVDGETYPGINDWTKK